MRIPVSNKSVFGNGIGNTLIKLTRLPTRIVKLKRNDKYSFTQPQPTRNTCLGILSAFRTRRLVYRKHLKRAFPKCLALRSRDRFDFPQRACPYLEWIAGMGTTSWQTLANRQMKINRSRAETKCNQATDEIASIRKASRPEVGTIHQRFAEALATFWDIKAGCRLLPSGV